MASNGIQLAFGGASILAGSAEVVNGWVKALEEGGIKIIDTAALYGASEELLGNAGAASKFTIDTKYPGGFSPTPSTKDTIIAACKESLKKLKTDSVDIYYIHAPDRRIPVKETLEGLNELYKEGAFKRLGISNFLADEVEEMVRVAKENGYVVPSVYQGNYSAVARRADSEIFPVIRKHNMSFYAYSPIAGGFLAKSKATLLEADGRFGEGQPLAQVFNGMFNRPSFVAALDVWEQIAEEEKVSRSELAYRWVAYHSKMQGSSGDVICVGARNVQQLAETVQFVKAGPLSEAAVKKIDGVWDSVKAEASLDTYEMMTSSR